MLRLHSAISTFSGSRLLKLCNPGHLRTSALFSTGKSSTTSPAVKDAESSDKAILKTLLARKKWVVFPNGSSYCGKLSDSGAMQGKGKFVSTDGSIYVGTFDDNVFSGPGKVVLANGCLLKGTFSNSQLHGYGGVFFTNGKSVYGYFHECRLSRDVKEKTCRDVGSPLRSWEKQMRHEPGKLVSLESDRLQGESQESLRGDSTSLSVTSVASGEISEVTQVDPVQSLETDAPVALAVNPACASLFSESNEPVWWKAPEKTDRNDFMSAINEILGHSGPVEEVVSSSVYNIETATVAEDTVDSIAEQALSVAADVTAEPPVVTTVKAILPTSAALRAWHASMLPPAPNSSQPVIVHKEENNHIYSGLITNPTKGLGVGRIEYPVKNSIIGVYEGEWLNLKAHGQGMYTDSVGTVLEGEFRDDQPLYTTGVQVQKFKGTLRTGQFKFGSLHGQGKVTYPDGRSHEGEFKEGVIHNGLGVLVLKSGDVYEGAFVEGKLSGQGTIIHTNGGVWRGEFKEGKMWTGTGVVVFLDGAVYEGEFTEGTMHGQGKITYPDGHVREGEFKDGRLWTGMTVFVHKDGSVYEGEYKEGKVHGQGKLTHTDGSYFEGAFSEGKSLSQGKLTFPNGHTLEGEFREGKLWNGTGTLTLKSRDVYKGDLKEGMMHGQGKLSHPDGRTLEGEFKEGKIWNGTGMLTFENGDFHEGEFRGGKMHGQGKITYADGRIREGEFKEGKIWNGRGIFVHKSGDVYEGEFTEGKMHGQGKLTSVDGSYFEGEFRGGKQFNGTSTVKHKDGSSESAVWADGAKTGAVLCTQTYIHGATYQGALLNDKKHGFGTLTFPAGHVYTGMFRNNLRHGAGTLRHKDGSVYEGEWVSDKEHGQGKLTRPNGTLLEGEFRKGKFVGGTGVFVYANGSTYEGEFLEGKYYGQGKITYSDGCTWEGEFVQGELRTGNGTRYFPTTRTYQTGQWLNGQLHGACKIFRKVKSAKNNSAVAKEAEAEEGTSLETDAGKQDSISTTEEVLAEGEFAEGKLMNGFAQVNYTLTHLEKTCKGKYIGDFTGGLPHGKGSFVAEDKSVSYVGKWVAGNLHGPEGREVRKDGTIYEGSFFAGTWHGQGKVTLPGGQGTREGIFRTGKLHETTQRMPISHAT